MLKPLSVNKIPKETVRVAQAAFPKPSTVMVFRDTFGSIYHDEDFSEHFPNTGQPAYAPWRLALITVFQFLENLTDRQAADAVRGRLDWKYALGLELTDPGFDASVLSEFRTRLVIGEAEALLLDKMLKVFAEHDLLKTAKQRTDSTHVIAAVRKLRRMELAGETMRAALNALASVEPDWLRSVAKPEWFERYSHRVEEYRFPKGKQAQYLYGIDVATDGFELLDLLEQPSTPAMLKSLPMVNTLREGWKQNFERKDGTVRWLQPGELQPSGERFNSPYDPEACYATRRNTEWVGYKVHLTETCESNELHLVTHVETTPSVIQDVSTTEDIHQALADKACLPEKHMVEGGYTDAALLTSSQEKHGITLVGPVRENRSWQAKAKQGFSNTDFKIDWNKKTATCPMSKTSYTWQERKNEFGTDVIYMQFRPKDCQPCASRTLCTKAKTTGRKLLMQPQQQQESLSTMRALMASDEAKELYKQRAGIEGTLSQGIRAMGLRHTRYRGLKRTHSQHVPTAAAINVARVVNYLNDVPLGGTRLSPFARLAVQT
jgi:transposase